MSDWATANLALRAARHEMDEAKRLEADLVAEVSSGNVFADLGLPDADRLLAEADARIAAGLRSPWARSRPVAGDCGCEPGALCRANAACPRAVAAVLP